MPIMQLVPFRDLIMPRVDDPSVGLRFEDRSWSWSEVMREAAARAQLLLETPGAGPLHVGLLLENVPEFVFWTLGAALAGGVVVGINPTRRGTELERDVAHTDCRIVVTDSTHADLLVGLDLGLPADRIFNADAAGYSEALAPHAGGEIPDVEVSREQTLLLIFTSGTSGTPKAVNCTQGKLALVSQSIAAIGELDRDTVTYASMPLFHSNALFTAFGPTCVVGGTLVLRRRFSASNAIPDIKKYGCTYFSYVGKPLSYILAQPERPDDADNPLRIVFGNEGADIDIWRFSQRFAVPVIDGYGSTETGVGVSRTLDMPRGALGIADAAVKVLDPETGAERPPASFDEHGRLTNAEEAIGELVNTAGASMFEGYYKNDEANAQRMRDGMFWSGDLAYKDEKGFFYFAGRDYDWLRVDGENFAAAPVERILTRFSGVVLASVYAVPDADVGDQVMAALELKDPAAFDPAAFDAFLATQADLGTKSTPRYVRVSAGLPVTRTSKVLKRRLRAQGWECDEPVFFRPESSVPLRPMTTAAATDLRRRFEARGREQLLP